MATQVSSSSISLGDAGKTKVQAIGTVKAVTGEAIVINASGVACTLKPGDKVFPNDIIQTSELGSVQIEFSNGQLADLGRTTSFLVDKDVYELMPQKALALNAILGSAGSPNSGSAEADVAAESSRIAKLLAEGADLTEILAPTAAGPANHAGVDQHGYGFVQIEPTGNTSGVQTSVDPTVASFSQPLGTDKTLVSGNAIQTGIKVGFDTGGTTSPSTAPADTHGQTQATTLTVLGDTTPPGRASVTIDSYINDSTPTINGHAEPGSAVNIVVRSTPQYFTTTANPDGSWVIQIPEDGAHDLEDGEHSITVQVVDAAGNLSETIVIPFTVDTVAPEGNFTISTSGRTGDNTPVIGGTAEAGSFIRVTLTGSATLLLTATDRNGNWSVESPSPIADGSYTVTATATDLAGNSASRVVSLTIDTTAPNVHVVTVPPVSEGANSPVTVSAADAVGSNEVILTITPPNPLPAGVTFDATAKTFTLNPADAAFQGLSANELREVTVTYTVSDGINSTQANILFEVVGVNDAPVAAVATASGNEDAIITGQLAASDPDTGATLTYTLDAPVAGLTLNTDGSYRFDAGNAAYQSLAAGTTASVAANYTVSDGLGGSSSSSLTLTLTGSNDMPVASVATASGNEDTILTGTLAATDPDTGATLSFALVTPVAGLTLDNGGSYSFDAGNAAYQAMAAGTTASVVANYTVSDGLGGSSSSTLTISLTGTNDVPVASVASASGNEDSIITGQLAASDPDAGNALTYTLDAPIPGLTLNTDGSYSFDAGNATYQAMAAGDTASVVANYTVSDSQGGSSSNSLTFTLTGTNDTPTIGGTAAGAATEDAAATLTATGTLSISDADSGESVFQTTGITASPGALGSLAITAAGAWTYSVANADVQSLAANQTKLETFTVRAADGTTHDVVITLTGTNDTPTIGIGSDDSAAVTLAETNAGLTASGTLTLLDVDVSDVVTASVSTVVAGGHTTGLTPDNAALLSYLTLGSPVDTAGTTGGPIAWSFNSANEAFNQLAVGESLTLTYTVAVSDTRGGTDTQDITITITGTDDSATVTAISSSTGIDAQIIEDFLTANSIDLSAYEIYYGLPGNDAGQDIWIGSATTDTLEGGNRDILIGGLGNDTLSTGGGATIIWGGPGDDTMTGGASGDRFVYMRGDLAGTTSGDIIDIGNGTGDIIDLRDLLNSNGVTDPVIQGATSNDAQATYYKNTGGSGVLSISINPADKTVVISVDMDGGGSSFQTQTIAKVDGFIGNPVPSATDLLTSLLGSSTIDL